MVLGTEPGKALRVAIPFVIGVLLLGFHIAFADSASWRSSLYPEDWEPGYADAEGRFLQDFSFAGYQGSKDIKGDAVAAPLVDVTKPPFNADSTGERDSTKAIQLAIDYVGELGGGTVYLPPGVYALYVPEGTEAALVINHSNVRLQGAGSEATFLELRTYQMRGKNMIAVLGEGNWSEEHYQTRQRIREDLTYPTQIIPLEGPVVFEVGDWVVLTHDVTTAWVNDHNMADMWPPGSIAGATFYRKIIDIDRENNAIIVDAPIRYYLLPRDNARVYKVKPHIEEVGISDLALGMWEHPGQGWDAMDFREKGTAAYDVHASYTIAFVHAVNCWVENVRTYKPAHNEQYHILSNGIRLRQSRFITVSNTDFRCPQYRGEGGNGYLYVLEGNDCLLTGVSAYNGRHNFSFKTAYASGNVITSSYSSSPDGLDSDFHMYLSPSNLIENLTLDQDRFLTRFRPSWVPDYLSVSSVPHGLVTTNTVFWNINGLAYRSGQNALIESEQYGWGYIIGTRGPASNVSPQMNIRCGPLDFVEGVGEAENLVPQSLYLDQLARRQQRDSIIHNPSLDFRPAFARIQVTEPVEGALVQGDVPLGIRIEVPTFQRLQRVMIRLNDYLVYSGTEAPTGLLLDTREYPDGDYQLSIRAITDNQYVATYLINFTIENWWEMTDELLGPRVLGGWFNTVVDYSKTLDKSEGWIYLTGDEALFFGDADRMMRAGIGREYLVWDAPMLDRFSLVAYVQDRRATEGIRTEVSADGKSWQEIDWVVTDIVASSAGPWEKMVLLGEVDHALEANYLRVTLEGEHWVDELQLGSLNMRGVQDLSE